MKNSLVVLLLIVTGCVSGSHLATGNYRPPTDAAMIQVYQTAPTNSVTLGNVSAFSLNGLTWQQAQDSAVRRLKREAAKLGANGIVVTGKEDNYYSGSQISGVAIFVP
jgi:hypothetical protein